MGFVYRTIFFFEGCRVTLNVACPQIHPRSFYILQCMFQFATPEHSWAQLLHCKIFFIFRSLLFLGEKSVTCPMNNCILATMSPTSKANQFVPNVCRNIKKVLFRIKQNKISQNQARSLCKLKLLRQSKFVLKCLKIT